MRPLTASLALLSLTACTIATSDATADRAPPGSGTCRNEPLGQFIGQPASEDLGAKMQQVSGARTIRWVPKGGVITMEFSPDRLTVQLDGANRVETARCG